jgi:predicted nuclease of predicted toxin-antitoxin system
MIRFLIDAQLPRRLARTLQSLGFDTIHTFDLPDQNATTDSYINQLSVQDCRVVVTKDSDFSESFVLRRVPYKLLLVGTGNIQNSELESLFISNLEQLAVLLEQHSFIELGRDRLVVHV